MTTDDAITLLKELFEYAEGVSDVMCIRVTEEQLDRWLHLIGLARCETCNGCGGCGEHDTDMEFGADPCPACLGSGFRTPIGNEEPANA